MIDVVVMFFWLPRPVKEHRKKILEGIDKAIKGIDDEIDECRGKK